MDVQIKKGILDACVLAAVFKQDSYGYKILQDLSGRISLSESTLYPILRRLEAAGCLHTYNAEYNGRLRKYYAITDAGRQRIQTFLSDFNEIMNIYQYIRGETNYDD